MTDPTIARIVGDLDAELAELSRLHMAYEEACNDVSFGDDWSWQEAAELSAAVGKFLVTRGYEGRI